ncbi:O-antigen ligase family protein [Citrobacter koseri]
MTETRQHPGQTGILAGALLCFALLYMPWGWLLHTGISVQEHAGWALAGLLCLLAACLPDIRLHRDWFLWCAGGLLTLPLLWMPEQADVWGALSRTGALWTGGLLFCWMAGRTVTERQSWLVFRLLALAGVVCALSVFLRVYWPAGFSVWQPLAGGGWVPGGALLPDLMATFLAVAVAAALHFWLFRARLLTLVLLAVLMYALTLCQSVPGLAGVSVVFVVMLLACARGLRRRFLLAGLVLAVAGVSAWYIQTGGKTSTAFLSLPASCLLLAPVTRACLALLMAHPLSGTGYGRFEGMLPDGLNLSGEMMAFYPHHVVSHPGNEMLYWAVEGGIVAVAGLLLFLFWGGRILVRLFRQAARVGGYGHAGSDALSGLVCALPVILFALCGTPWYQSPLHFLLSVMLPGMAVARLATSVRVEVCEPGVVTTMYVRILMFVAGAALMWFAVTSTLVAVTLQQARQSSGHDITALEHTVRLNPWYMKDSVHFARTVHRLQEYAQTGDSAILAGTEPFFRDYLIRHPDPNVYSMYITVLDKQGKSDEAERVWEEGMRRVPWDRRFIPDEPTGSITQDENH